MTDSSQAGDVPLYLILPAPSSGRFRAMPLELKIEFAGSAGADVVMKYGPVGVAPEVIFTTPWFKKQSEDNASRSA